MKEVVVEGTRRVATGKTHSKQERRAGTVPCVMYGGAEHISFSASAQTLKKLVYSPNFQKARIKVDGKEFDAIVKETQFHPVTDAIIHIDFQEMVKGRPVTTELPVHLTGRAKGMLDGGKLIQRVRKLKVSAMPEKLIDSVNVAVDDIGVGHSLHVKDLKLDGVTILNEPTLPVASVIVPRALKEETPAAVAMGATAAPAEGEAAAPAAEGAAKAAEAPKGAAKGKEGK